MKTIAIVAIVVVVGVFIGIIATADYGDFVKERELRNLELSYYELQQKIQQCEELSGYSQDTCKEELKRFEASHEKMIQRYEGFTGLEVYHMAKDGKNSLLQSNEFWDTYEDVCLSSLISSSLLELNTVLDNSKYQSQNECHTN